MSDPDPTVGQLATGAVRAWGVLVSTWFDLFQQLSRATVELAAEESETHVVNETVVHVSHAAGGPIHAGAFQPLWPGCAPLPAAKVAVDPAALPAGAAGVAVKVRVLVDDDVDEGGYVGSLLDATGAVVEPLVYLDVVKP